MKYGSFCASDSVLCTNAGVVTRRDGMRGFGMDQSVVSVLEMKI